jgi:citrate synthase
MPDTLTITDNRTGKTYELPITDETIRAVDLRQIKTSAADFGLMPYDPAYMNTASCKSRVTFIDGDLGILRYRGYPIDQLAEEASYLETAYLIYHGELPTEPQLAAWSSDIMRHVMAPEGMTRLMSGFRHDAHAMGMFVSSVAALGTYYPEAKDVSNHDVRRRQILRLVAKVPTLAAFAYRYRRNLPFVYPDQELSYAGNFLSMLFKKTEVRYKPNPTLERALDILFILHADHEQNCSTSTMRLVGSSHAEPYSALAASAAALYGPLHGGANEAVLMMLREIGSKERIPEFIKRVKAGEGRLMGFGHRVYKNYDPRARIIKRTAEEVFEVTGKNPLIDIAVELERIALEDEYFIKRKLYPNVDFYSGIIYEALGFTSDMFTVLFAIPRTIGWLTQWEEMLMDADQKIGRPRQIYLGFDERHFVNMADRK